MKKHSILAIRPYLEVQEMQLDFLIKLILRCYDQDFIKNSHSYFAKSSNSTEQICENLRIACKYLVLSKQISDTKIDNYRIINVYISINKSRQMVIFEMKKINPDPVEAGGLFYLIVNYVQRKEVLGDKIKFRRASEPIINFSPVELDLYYQFCDDWCC